MGFEPSLPSTYYSTLVFFGILWYFMVFMVFYGILPCVFPYHVAPLNPFLLGRSTEEKKAAESLDDQAAVKTMKQRVAEVGGAGGAAGKSPPEMKVFICYI